VQEVAVFLCCLVRAEPRTNYPEKRAYYRAPLLSLSSLMYRLQLIHRSRKRFLRLKPNDTSLLPASTDTENRISLPSEAYAFSSVHTGKVGPVFPSLRCAIRL
jgi:hypothetical protein